MIQDYKDNGHDIDTPCDECFPDVHPYNRATYLLYNLCADQLIFSFAGPVAINMVAVDITMNSYDVDVSERADMQQDVKNLYGKIVKVKESFKENKSG